MINKNLKKKVYSIIKRTLTRISPEFASKIMYRKIFGKKLNLKDPQNFNEKIMWLKLKKYDNNPIITKCADKYAVREYVEEKGCKEILNNLIGVYNSAYEIDWNILPQKFVLKCNHGSGMNIICTNKEKSNKVKILKQLEKWMHEDYYLNSAEINYKYIKKKIICEEYLGTDDDMLPNDYKIYCFNGEPKVILVCYERNVKVQKIFFNIKWEKLDLGNDQINSNTTIISKPKSFEKMLEYSKKLSQGFPFVRLDFYDVNGKAVFGEMTFTPAGGLGKTCSEYGLNVLGDYLKLPEE